VNDVIARVMGQQSRIINLRTAELGKVILPKQIGKSQG